MFLVASLLLPLFVNAQELEFKTRTWEGRTDPDYCKTLKIASYLEKEAMLEYSVKQANLPSIEATLRKFAKTSLGRRKEVSQRAVLRLGKLFEQQPVAKGYRCSYSLHVSGATYDEVLGHIVRCHKDWDSDEIAFIIRNGKEAGYFKYTPDLKPDYYIEAIIQSKTVKGVLREKFEYSVDTSFDPKSGFMNHLLGIRIYHGYNGDNSWSGFDPNSPEQVEAYKQSATWLSGEHLNVCTDKSDPLSSEIAAERTKANRTDGPQSAPSTVFRADAGVDTATDPK